MKHFHWKSLLTTAFLLTLAAPVATAETTYHPVWTNAEGQPWRNEDGLCWRDPTRTGEPTPACGDPTGDAPATTMNDDAEETPEAAEKTDQVREIRSEVLFAFDSAELTPRGRNAVRAAIGDIGADWRITDVEAVGHTDRLGSEAYNRNLSQARADAVADYLESLTTLDEARIRATGVGEADPVVECADDQSRDALIACLAPNRRTELVLDLTRDN
ncbi:OmpA family protein [Spiribacter onubensis]|uniref:OmpA family protein n=1 Tax=Spiribacter onubensis TaxID=3122420 RepID=A0ABV3S6T4_9GAMM